MATANNPINTRTGKNIVICCDGTGNKFIDKPDPDNSNSNVVKLYATLRIHNEQIAYYHPGVGTAGDPRVTGKIASLWSQIKGLAFAYGFKDNVLDAYQYLMKRYDDGDQVYMIGFSRGAYTVRALAGMLDGYGLLCKGNEGHLPYAWNAFADQLRDRKQHSVEPNERFKETFSRRGFRIHYLGIWDTVSSVGWITTPLRLYSVAQNPTVEIGRHAISIDERRCFYRDNLWEKATEEQLQRVATKDNPKPTQDVLQVWFPGVHSDIGGSYSQDSSVLSNHALAWMIDETQKAGAEIKPHMKQLVLGEPVDPLPDDPDEVKRVNALKDLFVKPRITMVHKSLKWPWQLLEVLPHRYYDKDDGQENWRTPLGMRRRLPASRMRLSNGQISEHPTYVHRTAREMMMAGSYKPKNVIGGVNSLKAVEVEGQASGSLYLYDPGEDAKPMRNEAWARWAVMLPITAVELAPIALLLWLIIKPAIPPIKEFVLRLLHS